jgi:Cu/Ag efflux protein CusF
MKIESCHKTAGSYSCQHLSQSPRFVLAVLGLLTLFACGKSRDATPGHASRSTDVESAAIAIDTATATATVKSIDYSTRTLTLESPGGVTHTYKAGNDVVNFDRIRQGDRVRATVSEALAISVRKAGVPSNARNATTVSLAPKGAKPGIFVANMVEVNGTIEAIDAAKRTITLRRPAGEPRTLKLAPTVKLANLRKGDDVVVRYTQAVALFVEKS